MMRPSPTAIAILLVDDDEVDVLAFRRALTKGRVANRLREARDGVEALAILRGEDGHEPLDQPFVILLDLNMPRMNGLQFLAELREDPELRSSRVVVLTTSDDDRDRMAAFDHHVEGYMRKGRTGEDVLNMLTMLDAHRRVVEVPPVSSRDRVRPCP